MRYPPQSRRASLKAHRLWLTRAVLCALRASVLIMLVGCSTDLLRFTKTGPPPVPAKPQPTYAHQEAVRELADLSARTLDRVHVEGAPAAAPSIGQAAQGAGIVSADVGPPAAPLPMPEPEAFDPLIEVEAALQQAARERVAYGRQVARYETRLADYAATPVKRTWSIGVPLLASWAGLLVLGLGVALAFRACVKYKTALWQVFLGVRDFLSTAGGQDQGAALKASLDKNMDQAAKSVVTGFYQKVGD